MPVERVYKYEEEEFVATMMALDTFLDRIDYWPDHSWSSTGSKSMVQKMYERGEITLKGIKTMAKDSASIRDRVKAQKFLDRLLER